MRKLLSFALVLAASAAFADEPAGIRVIVNPANHETSLTREQVSKLFLRKQTTWPSGGDVDPIELRAANPTHDRFAQWAHHKSASALAYYWQQQVFSGRGAPPPEKSSEAEVVEYVAQNPGAVGYVSAGAKVSGVKVVTVTD